MVTERKISKILRQSAKVILTWQKIDTLSLIGILRICWPKTIHPEKCKTVFQVLKFSAVSPVTRKLACFFMYWTVG